MRACASSKRADNCGSAPPATAPWAGLRAAKRDGLARQLFSVPGMMAQATRLAPPAAEAAAGRFAKDWDAAAARGDVAALDAALEALARALGG